jgi:hypothetical protein
VAVLAVTVLVVAVDSLVGTVALVVGALALVSIAYSLYRLNRRSATQLEREQLRAYHELMSAIVRLNRQAVGLHTDGFFQLEQERYVMDNESKMEGNIVDVVEVFHRSFYLVSPGVRGSVNDYVDYVTTYHVDGIEIGKLLKLSGEVVEAIRSDLGLETAFPDRRVDEDVSLDALAEETGGTGGAGDAGDADAPNGDGRPTGN